MLISITAVAEDHNYIYKSDIRTYIDNQEILGETVTTDIDVYFGTHRVTSYNTGGNMMICVEEMAETIEGEHYFNENAKMGYSDLGFKMVYDDEQRRLDLYSMRQGVSVETEIYLMMSI